MLAIVVFLVLTYIGFSAWESKLPPPPKATPPSNKGLIRVTVY